MNLKAYREFWEAAMERIPEISGVMGVTVDEDMARKIRALPLGSRTLFWIPPNMEGQGSNVDNYREKNLCVVFVMEKYDPSRKEAMNVLEDTQETIERVKFYLMDSQRYGCAPLKLYDNRINTLPETKFFAGFAGWSIGFQLVD